MYEYKAVPAPARAVKVRGLKTTEARFAHALTLALNEEAYEGWEYLRSESLPCSERRGLTGTRTTTQTVLIFRRRLETMAPSEALAEDVYAGAEPKWQTGPEIHELAESAELRGTPASGSRAEHRPARSEPVFRPGAISRDAGLRTAPPLRGGHASDQARRDAPDDSER